MKPLKSQERINKKESGLVPADGSAGDYFESLSCVVFGFFTPAIRSHRMNDMTAPVWAGPLPGPLCTGVVWTLEISRH